MVQRPPRPSTLTLALTLMSALALTLSARPIAAEEAGGDPGGAGKPLVHNYHQRAYGAEPQTWDVLQGDSGIMYFANNAGVLEYDGRTWRLIELPSRLDVRWLVKDPRGPSSPFSGRIYVGATGDFGYLAPDAAGQLQFRSLLPPEAREDKTFDYIFSPTVTPEGIAFHARNRICRWDDVKLTCRETEPSLSRIFEVNGRNYVQKRTGLMQMTGDTLRPVAGGERFTRDEITMLLPYGIGRDESLLVGTRDFRLYVQRDGAFVPFAAATREGHANEVLLRGEALPDGTFALATQYRGVLIVDRDGRMVRQIDQSAGLQANHVLAVCLDRDGGLWLALQNGISRVDVGSPFSIFDEDFGLEREWRDVLSHRGTLYVRGYKGLFAAGPASADVSRRGVTAWLSGRRPVSKDPPARGTPPRFRRVQELEPPVWSMVAVGDGILATSKDGLYELHGTKARRILTPPSTPVAMYRSRTDPRRVYVGLVEGVTSLRLTDGVWIDEGRVAGIDETITSMGEGEGGALWMVSQRQRILRAEFTNATGARQQANQNQQAASIRVYSLGRGVLTGRVLAREVTGRLVFLTEDGIYEFDSATETFVQSPAFAALTAAGRRSFSWIAEDSRGDVWVASRKPGAVDVLRRQWDGRYVADTSSLLQMPAWAVYPEPDGRIVWLSVPDYLLRYDLSIQSRRADFTTLIRKVTVNDDTLVYGGAPSLPRTSSADGEGSTGDARARATRLEFPYRSNSLHFEYAAPRFEDSERSEFQSYLEGFDRHWSVWSKEPGRSYTNLPAGDYRFHVRARDARGVVGRDAVFTFSVLRPWYRSWPAYLTYGLLLLGAVIGVLKVQLGRAQRAMQRDVEHRELEKLRELDRMKSRFFTDISHEFRTPLTLILAPVGQMLQDLESKTSRDARPKLLMVRRHAEYLLKLISQLLDLSKVESGTMRLQTIECGLGRTLEPIVFAFAAAAEQQGIDLLWEDCDERIALYLDREVIEKIVNNLLANALKFTPRGGTVTVRIGSAIGAIGGSAGPQGAAEIVVSDTGAGIAREHLPHIFDRFYQSDAGRSREGIGVGLALVKELVELQGGTIDVESVEGAGTIFLVRLPKGRAHLTDEQIIRTAETARPGTAAAPRLATPAPIAPIATVASNAPPAPDVAMSEPVSPAPDTAADALDDERTVLVVEDHAEVRAFLRDHLESHYRVLEARDGAEGLTVAVAELPDLVLSDVMMGPVNGYELCKALKTNEKTCHIPIVLLTARAGREDRLLGLDIGADCYLIKPFDPSELLVQVRNLIDQRRMLRERFSSSVVLKPSEMAVMPMDEAFLTRVLSVVERHLSDPEFDVERLGREVGLSRSQLHRKIRALTNQPPTLLIRSIRLQRAAELLRQEAGSVAEVAYLVGFSSQGYFAKCFREQFGCAPRDYADKVLQQHSS